MYFDYTWVVILYCY